MIKHFCDRCERPMETEDFNAFIRADLQFRILVSVVATDEHQKPISDICRTCILEIVLKGEPRTTMSLPPKHLGPIGIAEAERPDDSGARGVRGPTGAEGPSHGDSVTRTTAIEVAASQPSIYEPSIRPHEVQPAVLPEKGAAFDRVTNPPSSPRMG